MTDGKVLRCKVALLLSMLMPVFASAQGLPSLEFAEALKKIAVHGDMEDAAFVADALRLELTPEHVDSVGRNYILESGTSPFKLYYRVGPNRPEIGNRRSAMFSIEIDPDRYCLKIQDVHEVLGNRPLSIPVHVDYLDKDEARRRWEARKHNWYSFYYEFAGQTNFLVLSFTFEFQDCARGLGITQNQDNWRLPPVQHAPAAPRNQD